MPGGMWSYDLGNTKKELDRVWMNTLKRDFESCLKNVQSTGSFAHFEGLQNVPNPGLHIKDYGTIGLPLSENDAKALVTVSHQAPFGKGTETIVDTSVRKTWELSPTEFSLANPAWEELMKLIVEKVGKELGVDKTVIKVELYKLLLYEEGAMFKPHQDSEKTPGMFGTLVIALPSKHEGGEVHVTHAGRKLVLETSKFSAFDYSFLTWYSDVVHEVKPVTSGRRLVLTYNLVHTTSKDRSTLAKFSVGELKSIFSRWESGLKDKDTSKKVPQTLAYLFEHEYTNASLSYDTLKGHDRKVASNLKEACRESGFYFYLASCERRIEGGCDEDYDDPNYGYGRYGRYGDDEDEDEDEDEETSPFAKGDHHPIIDEISRSMDLQHVIELDGTNVSKDVQYDEDCIIQTNPFKGHVPDDEDYTGFTGNAGCSATHFYRRTVGVIMPSSSRIAFFLRKRGSKLIDGVPEINLWLDRLFDSISACKESESSRPAQEEVREICAMVLSDTDSWKTGGARPYDAPFPPAVLERVFAAAVRLDDYALFNDAFKACFLKLPVTLYRELGIMVSRNERVLELTRLELYRFSTFAPRYEALANLWQGFIDGSGQSPSDSVSKFVTEELHLAVNSMTFTSPADGVALVKGAELQIGQPGELLNIIIESARKNAQSTAMIVAFLTEIKNASPRGKIPESAANSAFKDLIKDLIDHFDLTTVVGPDNGTFTYSYGLGSYSRAYQTVGGQDQESHAVVAARQTGENLAALLRYCLLLGLNTELMQLVSGIVRQTQSLHVDGFHSLLLPLLKHSVKISSHEELSVTFPSEDESKLTPFHSLSIGILSLYIVRWVKTEPQPPTNWTRAKKGCGNCRDCLQLNRFILDPDLKVGHFAAAEKRRRHLSNRVGSEYIQETLEAGSPYTLVLTKTLKAHQAEKHAWQERVTLGMQHVREIGSEALMKVLLGKWFEPIWFLDIRALTVSASGPPVPRSANSPAGVQPPLVAASATRINQGVETLQPITNRKRRAMVDLTNDSD